MTKIYIFFTLLIMFFCLFCPINVFSVTPFFFDAKAFSVDKDNDGGDDYILTKFDVDLDEEIADDVTVIATLYDNLNKIVDSEQKTFLINGQEQKYDEIQLIPVPNIAGTYSVNLAFVDSFDEIDILNISYNPTPGSQPMAYFGDIIQYSDLGSIQVDFDVNIIQQMTLGVKVEVRLMDSAGTIVDTKTLEFDTYYDDLDYQHISLTPLNEDLYSVAMIVRPKTGLSIMDSRLLSVIYPPGTGAYFRKYNAVVFNDRVEVNFDVDLEYYISYPISVEAAMYDSNNDVVAYAFTSYITNSAYYDEKTITLKPENIYGDNYYVELVLYIDDIPSSYGYINDLVMGIHTITATAGFGGTITPSGVISVDRSSSQFFVIAPSQGYHVSDLVVDDESKGALTLYTFTDIKADHTIKAVFQSDYIKGDLNGDGFIKSNDAIIVLSYAANLITLTAQQMIAGDMNDDGVINTKDAILVLRKSAGLIAAPTKYDSHIKLVLPDIYGVAGENISVPLKASNINDVMCGLVCISYDSKVLKAINVECSQNITLLSNVNEDGKVYIAFITNGTMKDNILSNISFKVISDDASAMKITNAEFYRIDNLSIIADIKNGLFSSWLKPAKENALLQNFPNPFNPSTWIPYQLQRESDIDIAIYTESGKIVREFRLGRKPAGIYLSPERALYWDGRDHSGEKVASGVYFYRIQAGEFSAIRKMIVME